MMPSATAMNDEISFTGKEFEALERMAEAIMRHLDKTNICSIHDLRVDGFSINDIARYWADAWKLVEKKRPRRPY
jgi:hypothetical protein